MQVLDESSEPNAVVTIEDNKAAENIEIYLVCIFSIMQSQDSFAGKKHDDTLVRAVCVQCPWALQAEHSRHY